MRSFDRHAERIGATGRAIRLTAVGVLAAVACGPADSSRDWSGRYGTRVEEATTDCFDAEAPPSITGFILDLTRHAADSVTVTLNPIVRLEGRFEGDHLTARMKVVEPIGLPDSIIARTMPSDSLDTITYVLEADFAGEGFQGDYVIRSPDLRALFEGEGGRCDYRYGLAGELIPAPAPPGGSQ
ncbi:MAG: hypothetical protein H0W36_06485 [Gemmatimonadetes bacterium]|nr:hypothetical protein [Gemmatimonadota bacterium]